MASLSPQVIRAIRDWKLRADVEDLQNSYHAALGGLRHMEDEIETDVRKQIGIGPNDEFPVEDESDPDDPIARLYEDASERNAQLKRGGPLVRRAFLTALFHAWERYCNSLLRTEDYHHEAVRKMLIRDGRAHRYKIIRQLQLAANCAKHGHGDSCRGLHISRPDLFPRAKTDSDANERTLAVDEETLGQFFEAVLAMAKPMARSA